MNHNKTVLSLFFIALVLVFAIALSGCGAPEKTTGDAPSSCLEALDSADASFQVSSDFIITVSRFPDMVSNAMSAGMNYDVTLGEQILTDMETINGEIEDETVALREHKGNYEKMAEACRNGE
jgi:hypothetical protein